MTYRMLDLCCGGGMAARGYQRAGFYVIGGDIEPQPKYCGDEFHQGDWRDVLSRFVDSVDAIHASPPCQEYSKAAKQWRMAGKEYPDLIAPVRDALRVTGKPYVIENVPGAPLINPTLLDPAHFGINIHRPRLFETSFPMPFILLRQHSKKPVKMGRRVEQGDILQPVGHFQGVDYARQEMDIDWGLGQSEIAQGFPPAFTEYIGQILIEQLRNKYR